MSISRPAADAQRRPGSPGLRQPRRLLIVGRPQSLDRPQTVGGGGRRSSAAASARSGGRSARRPLYRKPAAGRGQADGGRRRTRGAAADGWETIQGPRPRRGSGSGSAPASRAPASAETTADTNRSAARPLPPIGATTGPPRQLADHPEWEQILDLHSPLSSTRARRLDRGLRPEPASTTPWITSTTDGTIQALPAAPRRAAAPAAIDLATDDVEALAETSERAASAPRRAAACPTSAGGCCRGSRGRARRRSCAPRAQRLGVTTTVPSRRRRRAPRCRARSASGRALGPRARVGGSGPARCRAGGVAPPHRSPDGASRRAADRSARRARRREPARGGRALVGQIAGSTARTW